MAMSQTAETWKHFPRYMIAAMLVVIAVNVRFIYIAVSTFPGAASTDDFDTSNRYDAILKAVAAQDALGWTEAARAQALTAVIDLTGPDHKPLTRAALTANAERPLGSDSLTALAFIEAAPGHYVATSALPMPGQWDLKLTVAASGHTVHVTRRIVAR
jgi:nitrogen fixation protein FixH